MDQSGWMNQLDWMNKADRTNRMKPSRMKQNTNLCQNRNLQCPDARHATVTTTAVSPRGGWPNRAALVRCPREDPSRPRTAARTGCP